MALPTTIADYYISYFSPAGVFQGSNGAYYHVAVYIVDTTKVVAYKATDPSVSFSQILSASVSGTAQMFHISAAQEGNTIHCFVIGTTARYYMSFNMATDTWSTAAATTFPGFSQVDKVVVRSNGDLIVLAGNFDSIMGGSYSRAVYHRRISGTWTATTAVSSTGTTSNYYPISACLGSSDRVHFFSYEASTGIISQRALTSTNVLQTATTSSSGAAIFGSNYGQAVSYTSGGTTYVAMAFNANGTIKCIYFTSSDTPTLNVSTIDTGSFASSGASLTVFGTTLYAFYGKSADGDVYVSTSTDGGATWSASSLAFVTALYNDPTVLGYTEVPYTRNSVTTFGLVFTYVGTATYAYNEYTLSNSTPKTRSFVVMVV